MKKIIGTVLAFAVAASSTAALAAPYSDTVGHWAEKQIGSWSEYGVISGFDGSFAPNRSITRGEYAVVLNRLMNYQTAAENTFSDLDNNFYTDPILKLNKAGVMSGFDAQINPKDSLTREQASVMMCLALGIEKADKLDKEFADADKISDWAKPYIYALVNAGLLNGSDGKLNPKNSITRAEVVTILDNAVLPVLKSGTIEDITVDKMLVISAPDVTVKNSTLNGKLIITEGVTSGNVTLEKVVLSGGVQLNNDRTDFITLVETEVDELKDSEAVSGEASEDNKEEAENKEETSKNDKPSGGGGGGGGGSSSGGATTPPVVDYVTENAEMVEKINSASADIALYLDPDDAINYGIFTDREKDALKVIKDCMDKVVTHNDKAIIDKNFIATTYEDDVNDFKEIYEEIEAAGESSAFTERLIINLQVETLEWLINEFGVDEYL